MQVERIVNHITQWLKDYSKKSKTGGFVIGVSGGIDSALTSTLCSLTDLPVWCVEMSIYQKKDQVNRALNHIQWLKSKYSNVESISIPLTETFQTIQKAFPKSLKDKETTDLALANTRARLRMVSLYYMAGIHKALVVGTGNKVEDFGIGFFTKYGDGGVDVSPIADLLKTEVYALSKHLNISSEILDAPPTDGLWEDDRTDEQQIKVSYKELEWAMDFMENHNDSDYSKLSEQELKSIKTYKTLNLANKHKMENIPVCFIPKNLK